jgi:hypothetical protein
VRFRGRLPEGSRISQHSPTSVKFIMRERILQLKLQNPDWGYGRIAQHLGCHKTTVQFYLKKGKAEHKYQVQKIRFARKKFALVKEFGGKCQHCSYNRCQAALEFHHLDATQKKFTITRQNRSLINMRKESEKCILLCANCHREIEYGLWKWEAS